MIPLPNCPHRRQLLSRERCVCRWDHAAATPGGRQIVALQQCSACPVISIEVAEAQRLAGAALDAAGLPLSLPVVALECHHRGPQSRLQTADLCGLRGREFPVFSCAVHGECTLNRICAKQTLRSCAACLAAGEDHSDKPVH